MIAETSKGYAINGLLAEMGGTGFEKFIYPCSELKEISRIERNLKTSVHSMLSQGTPICESVFHPSNPQWLMSGRIMELKLFEDYFTQKGKRNCLVSLGKLGWKQAMENLAWHSRNSEPLTWNCAQSDCQGEEAERSVWLWASYRLLPVVYKVLWMIGGRKYCKQGTLGIYSP